MKPQNPNTGAIIIIILYHRQPIQAGIQRKSKGYRLSRKGLGQHTRTHLVLTPHSCCLALHRLNIGALCWLQFNIFYPLPEDHLFPTLCSITYSFLSSPFKYYIPSYQQTRLSKSPTSFHTSLSYNPRCLLLLDLYSFSFYGPQKPCYPQSRLLRHPHLTIERQSAHCHKQKEASMLDL